MYRVVLVAIAALSGWAAVAGAAEVGQPGPMAPPPGVTAQPPAATPGTAAAPTPGAPPPTGIQLSINIAGEWVGQDRSGVAQGLPPSQVVVIYKPDGTFNQWTTTVSGFTVQLWGTYTISATSPSSGFMMVTPTGWSPQQWCGTTTGMCLPLNYTAQQSPITVIDQRTIQVGALYLQRQS